LFSGNRDDLARSEDESTEVAVGTEAKLTFKAAADSVLGDFSVKVTGHPTKGADASKRFQDHRGEGVAERGGIGTRRLP
jgi:hypothetical protein